MQVYWNTRGKKGKEVDDIDEPQVIKKEPSQGCQSSFFYTGIRRHTYAGIRRYQHGMRRYTQVYAGLEQKTG